MRCARRLLCCSRCPNLPIQRALHHTGMADLSLQTNLREAELLINWHHIQLREHLGGASRTLVEKWGSLASMKVVSNTTDSHELFFSIFSHTTTAIDHEVSTTEDWRLEEKPYNIFCHKKTRSNLSSRLIIKKTYVMRWLRNGKIMWFDD
jgi:hypothetical protein